MKRKIKLISFLIFVFVIVCALFYYYNRYEKIELPQEPDGIFSSPYTNKLAVIMDGKLTMYDETGRSRYIDTPFDISFAYPLEDSIYLIDTEGNLYEMIYKFYTEVPISDVILTDVKYFTYTYSTKENLFSCGAVTTKGDLYVWGLNRDNILGLGDIEYVPEPMVIENIKNAKKLQFCNQMTIVLTEDGCIYEIGKVRPEQTGENIPNCYQTDLIKVDGLKDVRDINVGYTKIILWEDRIEYWFLFGYEYREEGSVDISFGQDVFKCYSQSHKFCVMLSESGEVYCIGYDFAGLKHIYCKCISSFDKPHKMLKIKDADAVYASASVAYVKAGDEIIILKK